MQNEQADIRQNPLELLLTERIRATGPITFADFMGEALYHSRWGYYTRGPNIGPRGDFTTSPEASPLFGRLLARHIAEVYRLAGEPEVFSVVECGPGRGTLAHDLLQELSTHYSEVYSRMEYCLVEVSPALWQAQEKLLKEEHAGRVRWATSLEELESNSVHAVIGNEVVDAFPVHVLENRDGRISEWFVGAASSGLRIEHGAPSSPELEEFLKREKISLQPGERIEICLAAEEWIAQVARVLLRGVATIIDYGDVSPQRYSPARREGTLLAYHGGAVTDNVLARPGEQDLTALVDFTALSRAAQASGLRELGLTRQTNFLLGLGLGEEMASLGAGSDLQAALNSRRGMQALVNPDGLGRFHVLLLGKGVDASEAGKLSSLRYAHI